MPSAGETFVACDSEKEAKAFSDTYISEEKNKLIEDTKAKMSLDDLFSQIQSGNMKELDIIVKADVQVQLRLLSRVLSSFQMRRLWSRSSMAALVPSTSQMLSLHQHQMQSSLALTSDRILLPSYSRP